MRNFDEPTHPEERVHDALILDMEKKRVSAGEEFGNLYSDYHNDMQRVERASAIFESNTQEADPLGPKAEALIYHLLSDIKELDFKPTHKYDDYFHGVDMYVSTKNSSIPALATIDVTINQEDIRGAARRGTEYGEARPVGFEAKLIRSKEYVDRLASFDPTEARNLLSWIQSGGLHERHTKENDMLFKKAEQVMLLKYYKSPQSAQEPDRPGYVIGGPLSIVSIDTAFINKGLQGDKRALDTIQALSFLEFVFGILSEQEYLDSLVKRQPQKNLLFDTHYAKVNAWKHIINQKDMGALTEKFFNDSKRNPDFAQQFDYYRKTTMKVFAPKK